MASLAEDYLPIVAVGQEAAREKSLWRAHPFTSHLWWARRPLVACRAVVYGALVPASHFQPRNGPENKRQSLGRANAAKFVTELCKYPGSLRAIAEAQKHILDAHAERLTAELAEATRTGQWPAWVEEFEWPKDKPTVTRAEIEAGRAPRPRVLDMFAGGGAIPLEALRLGCEAYALDLNPVAHIIELCTLAYPQKYGKPDPNARGMTGPPGPDGKPTWGGLADEVRYWGNWVLEGVRREIGDLYPPVPDPQYKGQRPEIEFDRRSGRWVEKGAGGSDGEEPDEQEFDEFLWKEKRKTPDLPRGYLMPIAYLWTRTVKCKNPACGATVPLVRQTWLCKKKGRYVALRMVTPKRNKEVRFDVVEHVKESDFNFDPAGFSSAGNATCPFCGTVADIGYVKTEGRSGHLGSQLMAVVARCPGRRGRAYLPADERSSDLTVAAELVRSAHHRFGFGAPDEPIAGLDDDNLENTLGITVRPYGLRHFGHLFHGRQLAFLLHTAGAIRKAIDQMRANAHADDRVAAVSVFLGAALDRQAENLSSLCRWNPTAEKMQGTFGRQVITMVWDFCEASPLGGSVGDWDSIINLQLNAMEGAVGSGSRAATVQRGSATDLPYAASLIDAVVTDPPYYDNVPYADISDFFYVWLKRSVGAMFPEHFVSRNTPKKAEAIADAKRHRGNNDQARAAYERMIARSLCEANRVLKPGGILVVVYAHKTTLGWSTLVDAMRQAAFIVTEAWPLDTEMKTRLRGMESAALASSIFLVARKREGAETGSYEKEVLPELKQIVRERVSTLWNEGITGADLVIAAVGAGLRAFTKYERVEYANGEEVPAERFLAEVEGVVLDVMLEQIAGKVARGVTAVDPRSRFYVLWRYVYKAAAVDAGEAIVFTYGQHVELDGQKGLSNGRNPLVEKKKGKYRLRDFAERGDDDKLGLPEDGGEPAPLIDALHRVLWLMENRPRLMTDFLREARVNRDRLRVLAQALAGPALKGSELGEVSAGGELAALTKLTANWTSVVEDALMPLERGAR